MSRRRPGWRLLAFAAGAVAGGIFMVGGAPRRGRFGVVAAGWNASTQHLESIGRLDLEARKIAASVLGFALVAIASCATLDRAMEARVLRARLPNGLRVIIVRNTLAPVVATSVNYLVGSEEAPAGFPGMAHAQEHMMFRGSPGLSADQLANLGGILGGHYNANTRESLTQYLFTVPAEDLDVALHIEALRMHGVLDREDDWNRERGAIEQEVAHDLSDPDYVLYAKLRAAFFAGTPYEHDALGTRPSFDATTASMLKRFHDEWYAPNNAILVIAGDLEPKTTLAKVEQLFGAVGSKKLPPRPPVVLRPVRPFSIRLDTDRPDGTQLIAMRTPGLESPDFPALEVLSDVLSSHRFELYGLVPKGKAISASFSLEPLPRAGLAYATTSFAAGQDPKAIEREVRAILGKVARDGVPAALVEAAKLQERRRTEFQKNSIEGLASVWSDAIALYGLTSPDDDLARIEKVTVADVDRIARKYLDLKHAISAVLIPRGSGTPVASRGGIGAQESISLGEARPAELPVWAQPAPARLAPPAPTARPVLTTLPNGLTLIVQPEDISDTVSVLGHIRNRPEIEEPRGQEGVSQVVDELFSFGTEHLDRIAFEQAIDAIGARERAGTEFSIEVLTRDFERGVELLADNELHPAFPAEAMEIVRGQIADRIAARNTSPSYLTERSLRAALFPKDDPILREATRETIRSLTLDQVRSYYQYAFRPDLATIVVVGKVAPDQARAVVAKYFGAWTSTGPTPNPDLPPAPPNRPKRIAVPNESRVQDAVILAQTLALTRADPDYYALELGSAVLGGGFYSTRLSIDLRENSGLAYSVRSDLQAGRTRGAYLVRYSCDPINVSKASEVVVRDITSLQNAPVREDELARAQALLIRRILLSEASIEEIAHALVELRELGLPLDEPAIAARRYAELGNSQLQAAFRKWIRPANLVQVSEGPPPR